jgi:uncharacterized protein (DUF1499 family)
MLTFFLVALVIGYLLLEKRPGYGAYYGIAKLTGAKLDTGRVDFATLARRPTRNDALVCPPGFCGGAKANWEARIYDVAPRELLDRVRRVALAEPDTRTIDSDKDPDRVARFIQYSRRLRFPDTIDVEVIPVGDNKSTLAIYSRSLVGLGDAGVNRKRVERWLKAL